jgi:hypothetical protein
VWQDGALITWSNWSDGEPNSGTEENAAASAMDGRWVDISATFLSSFVICEIIGKYVEWKSYKSMFLMV